MNEYSITLFEACELLNRSKKTLSRYIRQGRLNPQTIRSQQGTPEYRFSKADLEAFKLALEQEDRTGQAGQELPGKTGRSTPEDLSTGSPLESKTPVRTVFTSDHPPQDNAKETGRDKTGQAGQVTQDRADSTDETHQNAHKTDQYEGIITILKETTEILKGQLTIKDTQIETLNAQVHQLIERDRETNILLKGLHDRMLGIDPPKQQVIDTARHTRRDGVGETGQVAKKGVRPLALALLMLLSLGWLLYINFSPLLKLKR